MRGMHWILRDQAADAFWGPRRFIAGCMRDACAKFFRLVFSEAFAVRACDPLDVAQCEWVFISLRGEVEA